MRITLLILLLSSLVAAANDGDRYVKSVTISTNLCVVVAEGDMEWRSIGSYTIRLHELDNNVASQPAGEFYSGLVRGRDGTVEAVILADVDADGQKDVVVKIRNVGTGAFLSADAFAIHGKQISLLVHVESLQPNANYITALQKQLKADNAAKLKK